MSLKGTQSGSGWLVSQDPAPGQAVGGGGGVVDTMLSNAIRSASNNVRTRQVQRIVNLSVDALAITAVSRSSNAVFTVRNNLIAGEKFKITSVANMASLAGVVATVISATSTSIITSLNTAGEAADGGAGTATVQPDTTTMTITAITQAKRAVVTGPNTMQVGSLVTFDNAIGGMTQLRGKTATVVDADPAWIKIDIDTSAYTAFTAGGTATAFVQNGRIGYDWDAQYWDTPTGYDVYRWMGGVGNAPLLVAPNSSGIGYDQTAPFDMEGGIWAKDNNSGAFRSATYYPPDGLTRGWAATASSIVDTDDLQPIFKLNVAPIFYVQIDNGDGYARMFDSMLGSARDSTSLLWPSVRTRPGANGTYTVRFDFRQAGGRKFRGIKFLHALDYGFSDIYLSKTARYRKPARLPQMFLIGDSLPISVVNGNVIDGFGARLANKLGMEYISVCEGGTGYLNDPAANDTRPYERINLLAAVTQYKFSLGIMAMGHNDADNSTPAAIADEMVRCVNLALSKYPGIKLVVFGPGQNGITGSSANRIACDTAMAAAVAANFQPSQVQFKPIASAIPEYIEPGGSTVAPTGNANSDLFYDWAETYNTLDNTHGNYVYHTYVAGRMYADVVDALAKMQAAGG